MRGKPGVRGAGALFVSMALFGLNSSFAMWSRSFELGATAAPTSRMTGRSACNAATISTRHQMRKNAERNLASMGTTHRDASSGESHTTSGT